MVIGMSRLRAALGGGLLVLLAAGCAPGSGPGLTQLEIATVETGCGGMYNPDLPPCRTEPASRQVLVSSGRDVVATGTTGPDGLLVVGVPAGDLVVSAVDAEPYMECDTPTVTAVAGRTTPVLQTCTVFYP